MVFFSFIIIIFFFSSSFCACVMLACIPVLYAYMLLFHHVNVHNSFSKVNCNKEFEFEFVLSDFHQALAPAAISLVRFQTVFR